MGLVAVSPNQSPLRHRQRVARESHWHRSQDNFDRAEGVTSRRRMTLLDNAVAKGTLKRYRKAVVAFFDWAMEATGGGEDPSMIIHDEDALDRLIAEYIQYLYDEGGSKSLAKATKNGLCLYFPYLRPLLPLTDQVLKGWSRLHKVESYPPLTWELASSLAVHLATRPEHARHAIGVVLSFDCLLRVSELVNLKREDIAFDDDPRLGARARDSRLVGDRAAACVTQLVPVTATSSTSPRSISSPSKSSSRSRAGHTGMRRPGEPAPGTIVIIRQAKTGRNQSVVLHDASLTKLLHELVDRTAPGHFLFPFSAATFRRVFKKGCAELGLSDRYVPHSLRHGGATRYKHRLGWSMEDVMHRGRWASSKSAKTYIQASVAHAMSVMVPQELHDLGFEFSNALDRHLSLTRHISGIRDRGGTNSASVIGPAATAGLRSIKRPRRYVNLTSGTKSGSKTKSKPKSKSKSNPRTNRSSVSNAHAVAL